VGADLVVETAGLDACRAEAVDLIRKGGTVGCFGYPERAGLAPFPVQAAFRKAARVRWVSGAQAEPGLTSFREAVRLVSAGEVDVDFCLQHAVGLESAVAGVEVARAQGPVIKIVVDLRASASRPNERN
jgi:L-iditol 2-dehydrogenase